MLPVLSCVKDFDDLFLLEAYASTRLDEMAIMAWTDEQKQDFLKMQLQAQHDYYRAKFPDADYQIVNLDEKQIGRLYVARTAKEIKILDITVLPEFRGRGIGTKLVRDILEEAAADGKSVEIYIESFNPSANLFSRLGFQTAGEEGVHVLWRWNEAEKGANAVGA